MDKTVDRILFFDIDGVLNSSDYAEKLDHEMIINGNGEFPDIDPEAVARFNRIIIETDCEIVLSSGWRYFDNIGLYLNGQGIIKPIYGVTPLSAGRGFEISMFMHMMTKHPVNYAILDDNDFGISDLHGSKFVKTEFSHGITESDAEKVIEILKNK